MANEPIKFTASISKITTVSEGGWNVTVSVPETELVSVLALMPGVRKWLFKTEMTPQEK